MVLGSQHCHPPPVWPVQTQERPQRRARIQPCRSDSFLRFEVGALGWLGLKLALLALLPTLAAYFQGCLWLDIDVRWSHPDQFLSLRHVRNKVRVLKQGLFLPPLSFIGLTFLDFARSSIWTTVSAKRCSHLIPTAMLPCLTWFIWQFGTTIPKVVVLTGDQIPLSGWCTTTPLLLEETFLTHCYMLLPLLLILKEVFPLPLLIAILQMKVHT